MQPAAFNATPTPSLLIDVQRLDANIERMHSRLAELGTPLRPHVKTVKCVEAARRAVAKQPGGIVESVIENVANSANNPRDNNHSIQPNLGRIQVSFVEYAARNGKHTKPYLDEIRAQLVPQLDDVRVPRENVLGQIGGGFKVAQGILNDGRIGLSASAVGQAQAVLRLALAHATSRRQFGRVISELPGLAEDSL